MSRSRVDLRLELSPAGTTRAPAPRPDRHRFAAAHGHQPVRHPALEAAVRLARAPARRSRAAASRASSRRSARAGSPPPGRARGRVPPSPARAAEPAFTRPCLAPADGIPLLGRGHTEGPRLRGSSACRGRKLRRELRKAASRRGRAQDRRAEQVFQDRLLAWRRFSAWSNTRLRGPSSTSSVISSPRWAGRQCITQASGACASSAAFTW